MTDVWLEVHHDEARLGQRREERMRALDAATVRVGECGVLAPLPHEVHAVHFDDDGVGADVLHAAAGSSEKEFTSALGMEGCSLGPMHCKCLLAVV